MARNAGGRRRGRGQERELRWQRDRNCNTAAHPLGVRVHGYQAFGYKEEGSYRSICIVRLRGDLLLGIFILHGVCGFFHITHSIGRRFGYTMGLHI
jgi:hypothetical protein